MENNQNTEAMEQIVLHIVFVKFFQNEDKVDVQLKFKEEIDGFISENGVLKPAKVSQFTMSLRKLTAQLCEANDDFAFIRTLKASALTESQTAGLLFRAQLVVNRELHKKGTLDENNKPLDRDKYYTIILKYKMSEKSKEFYNKLSMSLMMKA